MKKNTIFTIHTEVGYYYDVYCAIAVRVGGAGGGAAQIVCVRRQTRRKRDDNNERKTKYFESKTRSLLKLNGVYNTL